METEFRIIDHGSRNWEKAVRLREEILRKPLGSVFSAEELEEEKNHIQVVGVLENEIVATAVLVPEESNIKMQRVVVSDQLRNLNLGSRMMSFCEAHAKSEGFSTVYCHARDSAVRFYLKNGYSAQGDCFDEDGIPHLKMTKEL